jgi:hypothetical protein
MALTCFGLRLTASGSQDADLGSTGRCFNLEGKLLHFVEGNAWAKTVPSGGQNPPVTTKPPNKGSVANVPVRSNCVSASNRLAEKENC